jgi:hypothetical protein
MIPDKPASAREHVAEPGMVPDARRCKCEDNAQADFDPKGFDAVLAQEYETIRRRRSTFEITCSTGAEHPDQRPTDLFGIALSGGGIRSSSFCLGALQALDQYGLLCRADYLSTVSGGGYIAASMVAAMNTPSGRQALEQPQEKTGAEDNTPERSPAAWIFPFTAGSNSDVSDTKLVGHIRDNSKFLAPHGLPDIGVSCAVLMRGLAVNLLMLLAVLLPLATIIIIANPTTDKLRHSILLDLATRFGPDTWSKLSFLSDPFILSKMTAIVLIYWLIGWAIFRSHKESDALRKARKRSAKAAGSTQDETTRLAQRVPAQEQSGKGAKLGRFLLIVLIIALAIEVQPQIINGLLAWMKAKGDGSWLNTIVTLAIAAGSIIIPTAVFESKLVAWIEHAMSSSKWGIWLQALLARAAFYALGLALPLVVYGLFLFLVIVGIKLPSVEGNHYPYSPSLLVAPDWTLAKFLGITLGLLLCLWLALIIRSHYGRLHTILKRLEFDAKVVLVILSAAALLAASAYATRVGSGEREWIVLTNYVLLTAIVLVIAANFTENANGLHRLYRDRLRHTFNLNHIALHELDDRCPYLLINGTLNVRRPRTKKKHRWAGAQTQAETSDHFSADPAKRGRNAEFFLLSRHFIGSDATGYACSRELNKQQPELDLAAAVAISGAAVSSSMGRVGIGLLGPTLALLNLRLGYWLRNPRKLDPDQLGWEEIFRRYLFDEAFGHLHTGSPRIYITDGGHIDNIGLYQLLKRRCRFIIVIDAEADPGMNFSAFADVQRFARIDEGVLISLDWRPMRAATLARLEDRTKSPDAHKLHFAAGHILYKDGSKGMLLYVKATVTGDEPDYILDYERRYPTFPHESTSDQFFSEEQMEAYRALGFHAMRVALDQRPAIEEDTAAAEVERDRLVNELKNSCKPVPA